MSLCGCKGGAGGSSFVGGPYYELRRYGAAINGCRVTDGVMNAGSGIVTSASGQFSGTAIGQYAQVSGAGAAGGVLQSAIASVQSAAQATLFDVAGTSVTNAAVLWGSKDDAAIANVIAAGFLTTGGILVVDRGIMIVSDASDGLLHITKELGTCGLGWAVIGFGWRASVIAQAGGWPGGLLSTFGRHGFGNGLRAPLHTCGWSVQGDPGFGGTIIEGWQAIWTGEMHADDFPGQVAHLTSPTDSDFYIEGARNGKMASGAPTLAIVQNDEGGTTVGQATRTRARLHITDNRDHGVFCSQDVDTILAGYVQGSGLVRSNVWSTDSTGLDVSDLTCDTAGDDNVHLQSEGNAAYARARGHCRGAAGTTPGTGHGVNVASA